MFPPDKIFFIQLHLYLTYDPLYLVVPVVILTKELYQDVCSDKFTWDKIFSRTYQEHWEEILVL